MNDVRLTIPSKVKCKICNTKHAKGQPHCYESMHFKYWFRKKYKRLPKPEDAAIHCTEAVKKEYMKKRGVL